MHFSETQKAYSNAIGIDIASQTFSMTRAIVGPEVGYVFTLANGAKLEPTVGVKAVWDFSHTEETTAAGQPAGSDGLTARVEAGLAYRTPAGIAIQGAGSYDGLGSSIYQSLQGRVRVTIPLQQ